jgi:acetylornithine deacetylase
MDTVTPHIDSRLEGETIHGCGACGDNSSTAAQIMTAEQLRAEHAVKDGDLSLLFVVGKEKRGRSMIAANDMDLS